MQGDGTVSRRALLVASAAPWAPRTIEALPWLRVTGFDLLPVRATERTVWLIVRLRTNAGLTGLVDASDAFGFANTTKQDAARMESELRGFFGLIDGKSPLEIGAYRLRGSRYSSTTQDLLALVVSLSERETAL